MSRRNRAGSRAPWRCSAAAAVATVAAAPPEPAEVAAFWGGEPPRPFDLALVLAGAVTTSRALRHRRRGCGSRTRADLVLAPCGTAIVAAVLTLSPIAGAAAAHLLARVPRA